MIGSMDSAPEKARQSDGNPVFAGDDGRNNPKLQVEENHPLARDDARASALLVVGGAAARPGRSSHGGSRCARA
jgi:hypothetical protein